MQRHLHARLTTGFARENRSFYLDDMVVSPGDIVLCKADITGRHFTPGKPYRVLDGGAMADDLGHIVHPSARFTYAQAS